MSTTELHDLTLSEASELIAARKLSPVEYTRHLLARTDALEPQLHAFITRTPEIAVAAARAAEDAQMRGVQRSPLDGIPIALKDVYDTAGILTTGHSRTCIDRVPAEDATTVRRLLAAGMALTGKLATHEFAYGGPSFDLPWPPARNPWNTAHFTGGSSSGSGAALAARLVPASLGSDTGGSIRGPAALCGVAGLKPTYGLVSRAGVLPNSYSYDSCGPMARTALDCALLLQAIAGADPAGPASSTRPVPDFTQDVATGIAGLRIGVIRHFWEKDLPVNAEVSAALEQSLQVLRDLGASTEDVTMQPLQAYCDVRTVMAASELFSLHLPELVARPHAFGQDFRLRILAACLFTAEDYVRASRERRRMIEEMQPLYGRFDLLVTANHPPAPRLDSHDPLSFWQRPNFTAPFNVTGGPALALPCGFSRAGLPMSLQIAGRPHEDALVLRAGHAFEKSTGFYKRAPDLKPGAEPAVLDPKPWRPNMEAVGPAVRALAETAATRAGLTLSPEIMQELVVVAPFVLTMARRLRRDHPRTAEISPIFDPVR